MRARPKLSAAALRSLARALGRPGALRGRRIGARLREQIVLHVSAANSCSVCSAIHGHAAKWSGLSEEEIRAARRPCDAAGEIEAPGGPALDERTRAALRYAELRTAGLTAAHPADVARFEAAFSPEERAEVEAIVDLFTFNNGFNNTWEAVLPGATRRRRRLGID